MSEDFNLHIYDSFISYYGKFTGAIIEDILPNILLSNLRNCTAMHVNVVEG